MSWGADRSRLLLILACILGSLLTWGAGMVWGDVDRLKTSDATQTQALNEINRRLERIESKLDDLNMAVRK